MVVLQQPTGVRPEWGRMGQQGRLNCIVCCVSMWCACVVCTWCVHVVCACGVCMWCVHVLCACVVCLWCDTTTSVCVPLMNALCEVTELLVVA